MVIGGHSVVNSLSFGGHSVDNSLSFGGHSVDNSLSFSGHSVDNSLSFSGHWWSFSSHWWLIRGWLASDFFEVGTCFEFLFQHNCLYRRWRCAFRQAFCYYWSFWHDAGDWII